MTAQKYLAYTYIIGWTDQDRWYYGLRYENIRLKRTPEDDFWTYYKTSSKPVKQMRAFIGEPNYISIDKTFESIEEAIEYENQILTEMNVLNNDEWLNESICGLTKWTKEKIEKRRKTNENKLNSYNRKQIEIDNIVFNSMTEAAEYYNISRMTLNRWIEEKRINFEKKNKEVKVRGIVFPSLRKAAEYYNTNRYTIKKWINGNKISKRKTKKVKIDNVIFQSTKDAAYFYKTNTDSIKWWIKSVKEMLHMLIK